MITIQLDCSCGATIQVRYAAGDDVTRSRREAAARERDDALKALASWKRAHNDCIAFAQRGLIGASPPAAVPDATP